MATTPTIPTSSTEAPPSPVVAFYDARWKTRWIFLGLAVVLLWRCSAFVYWQWLWQLPVWLVMWGMTITFLVFLAVFPLLTRNPHGRRSFGLPGPRRCLVEFAVAIPTFIGMVVVLAAFDFLMRLVSPEASQAPEITTHLVQSSSPAYVYLFFLCACTIGPIAEELFYRGFLHNALRARMPMVVAVLLQSLVFGFSHFYSPVHCSYVVVIGLLLTLVYTWRKTLLAPMILHSAFNTLNAIGVVVMMAQYADGPVIGIAGDVNDATCVIREVLPDSAAEKVGLLAGDVITAFNGDPIADFSALLGTIQHYQPGDTVLVEIDRSGTSLQFYAVLQRRGDSPPGKP